MQNLGATTATVTIWYSDGLSDSLAIASNAASLTVYMEGEHATFFSAHVESTNGQPLVAVANAAGSTPYTPTGWLPAQTYECAPAGAPELHTPLAMKWFIGQYNTGLQVQNIGATATDICIEYEGGYDPDCQEGVAPNGVAIFNTHFNNDLPKGWSGSARVYSTGNDLVGIVNQNNENPAEDPPEKGDLALSFLMFGP